MMCKPEDAGNYMCCSIDRPCAGDKCMAWRTEYKEVPNEMKHRFPRPPEVKPTGRGYCGLCK